MELAQRALIRPYEVVILMHPDSTDDHQKELFRRNKSIVEQYSGEIHHLDTWGRRNLSNPIEKSKKAIFFHCTFTAAPKAIMELERTMRINDRVLRFTHTRLPEGTNLTQYLENFKKALAETAAREKEREAKNLQRKAMARGGRDGGPRGEGGGFGGREGGGGRGERSERGERGEGREGADSRSR
jgi:small subunit ribosomal protein S6